MLEHMPAHRSQTRFATPRVAIHRDVAAALRAKTAALLGAMAMARRQSARQMATLQRSRTVALAQKVGGMLAMLAKARGEAGRMCKRQRNALASERRRDTRNRLEGFRELRLASGRAMRRQLAAHLADLRAAMSEFRRARQGHSTPVADTVGNRGRQRLVRPKPKAKRRSGNKR